MKKGPHQVYEGFGDTRSAAHWARIARVPRTTFWRHLKAGRSVEDIFALYGRTYTGESPEVQKRTRWGARMLETKTLLHDLLRRSEYSTEDVGVAPLRGTALQITYNGGPLGVYDYKADRLTLTNGESLRLKEPLIEADKIKIARYDNGLWEVHPKTRLAILTRE